MRRIRAPLAAMALLMAIVDPGFAQVDTTISGPRAFALIQSGKLAEAETMLETLTAREPQNPRAWTLLAMARYQMKDYRRSLEADLKAASFEQSKPAAWYNAGLMYALLGERDSAFVYLSRAKGTGRIDLTQIGNDSDAVSLRTDPRFRLLFPTEAEFAHPFVEQVTIIREWRGEAANDQFGWLARNSGDMDGDKINDVITSAPSSGAGGANGGKVYAYSSRSGRLLWTRTGDSGDQLGFGVEAAGDVNRDGVADVIVGTAGAGKAFVFSGRDGSTLLTFTGEKDDAFGQHVADLGDVNGDGFDDVIVSAPNNDAGGQDAGRAYVYSGRDAALLHTLTGEAAGDHFGSTSAGETSKGTSWIVIGASSAGAQHTGRTYVYRGLTARPAFVIEADSTGSGQGAMFVAVPGDVDGDGTDDIYSSDWSNNARGRNTGRIYVYSGKTGKPILTLTGENAGEGFGTSPSDAGDVNGDGHADLAVGAWQFAGAAPSGGKIYVYSGKDGSLLRTVTGQVPGETLGFDSTGLGDVDGDGIPDLLVSSAWSAVSGTHAGRVYILKGTK
ncbi:MAG: FG-GAP-like repeat-containing protein [Gemmatimonadota bacterium]